MFKKGAPLALYESEVYSTRNMLILCVSKVFHFLYTIGCAHGSTAKVAMSCRSKGNTSVPVFGNLLFRITAYDSGLDT